MADQYDRGQSPAAIAAQLNTGGVPTAQDGAKWYPATVRKIAAAGQSLTQIGDVIAG